MKESNVGLKILYVIAVPVFVIGYILYSIVAKVVKFLGLLTDNGKNSFAVGTLIFMIPALCLGAFCAYWALTWVWVVFSLCMESGNPILIFFGVVVPVVGSNFMLRGVLF